MVFIIFRVGQPSPQSILEHFGHLPVKPHPNHEQLSTTCLLSLSMGLLTFHINGAM